VTVQTETISVPEIHCDHCKQSIEQALNPLDGVSSAVVDVPNAQVQVSFEEAAITKDAIIAAIEEQGYEVPAQA
jgi:copper chaperone